MEGALIKASLPIEPEVARKTLVRVSSIFALMSQEHMSVSPKKGNQDYNRTYTFQIRKIIPGEKSALIKYGKKEVLLHTKASHSKCSPARHEKF